MLFDSAHTYFLVGCCKLCSSQGQQGQRSSEPRSENVFLLSVDTVFPKLYQLEASLTAGEKKIKQNPHVCLRISKVAD